MGRGCSDAARSMARGALSWAGLSVRAGGRWGHGVEPLGHHQPPWPPPAHPILVAPSRPQHPGVTHG